jgi:transposase
MLWERCLAMAFILRKPSYQVNSLGPNCPASGAHSSQRTMLVNALRAHLAEFGIIAPQGLRHVERLAGAIEEDSPALPELARSILRLVVAQLNDTQAKVRQIEAKLTKWHRSNRVSTALRAGAETRALARLLESTA